MEEEAATDRDLSYKVRKGVGACRCVVVHWCRPMREAVGHDGWVLPLVHGFWQQRQLALFGRTLTLTLIARRSRQVGALVLLGPFTFGRAAGSSCCRGVGVLVWAGWLAGWCCNDTSRRVVRSCRSAAKGCPHGFVL